LDIRITAAGIIAAAAGITAAEADIIMAAGTIAGVDTITVVTKAGIIIMAGTKAGRLNAGKTA
jgi:hypothetical protein